MNTWWQELILVLVSSGVVGSVITSVSKRRVLAQSDNIKKVVQENIAYVSDDVKTLSETQHKIIGTLGDINTELGSLKQSQTEMQKSQKTMQKDMQKMKKESEKVDFLFLKKLREKHVLNGESDEIFEYLLNQKDAHDGE